MCIRARCYNISQQGMFWKRSLFDKIGYLDETFHAIDVYKRQIMDTDAHSLDYLIRRSHDLTPDGLSLIHI